MRFELLINPIEAHLHIGTFLVSSDTQGFVSLGSDSARSGYRVVEVSRRPQIRKRVSRFDQCRKVTRAGRGHIPLNPEKGCLEVAIKSDNHVSCFLRINETF